MLINIMLTLKNIKKTAEYIEADYVPEADKETGHIKVDLATSNIIEKKTTSRDGVTNMYLRMARQGLLYYKDKANLDGELPVMWY